MPKALKPEVIPESLQKVTPEMDLNSLFKFVKSYDGTREILNSFITNCNNAYQLATESQKPILFKYILSRLEGKAEVVCSIKEFSTWEQLKEFLKTQFCDRKHYAYLLTELQESKQSPLENVNEFALKIETCLSRLLTEVSLSTAKAKELPGRIAAMEDLALHHFTMGLLPRISNMVRCRSPQTLNEAVNYAINEERIQQSMFKRKQPTENRFSRPNKAIPPRSQQSDICRYCKFPGHSIENCRKREYNNNRFRNNEQPSTSGYKPPQQVNFVEESNEQGEFNDETDNDPKNY